MELTMSMFATQADYWKARAELAERTVLETAKELDCEPDNEAMLERAHALKKLVGAISPFVLVVKHSNGAIPTARLSFADWHCLVKAADALTPNSN